MTRYVDAKALEALMREWCQSANAEHLRDGLEHATGDIRAIIATARAMQPATEAEIEAARWCVESAAGVWETGGLRHTDKAREVVPKIHAPAPASPGWWRCGMNETWVYVQYPPPHEKLVAVRAMVTIRENSTGEMVTFQDDLSIYEGEWSNFLWSEGNYSCDCNRALLFARSKGMDDPDIPCSEDLFSVRIVNPDTGTVLYDEL